MTLTASAWIQNMSLALASVGPSRSFDDLTEIKQTVLFLLWGGLGGRGIRTWWVTLSGPAEFLV